MQVLRQHRTDTDTALWSFLPDPQNKLAVATAGPPPAVPKKAKTAQAEQEDIDEEEALTRWDPGTGPAGKLDDGRTAAFQQKRRAALRRSSMGNAGSVASQN